MDISKDFIVKRTYDDSFLTPNQPINFHFWNKGKVELHSHEYFEIFLVTKGRVLHTYNGQASVLKAGTLFVMRPGDVHSFTPCENEASEHFNVRITDSLCRSICRLISTSLFAQIVNSTKAVTCKLKKIEMEYFLQLVKSPQFIFKSAEDESALSIVQVILTNFLLYVHHSLKEVSPFPKWFQAFLDQLNDPRVFSLPLSEIYRLSGYSQTRLNTYFKRFTNTTLIAYMTKLKLSYACNLLQTTSYTVLEISLLASFNTLCHFNYVFKKNLGLTPTEYRRKFQQFAF